MLLKSVLSKRCMKLLCLTYKGKISTQKMQKYPIEPYQLGQRLDRYLKKSPIGWIAGQIHLRKKDIIVQKKNGTFINRQDYKFQEGDTLLVSPILKQKFGNKQIDEKKTVPREEATRILDRMILFDNQNVTIVNKQSGYSVQGGINAKTNLFSLMCSKYKKQLIHITHRLDKSTSGLVIFAKNKQTAQLIQTSMEERNTFSKFYLAETQGAQMIQKQGYIRANIEWTGKNKSRICSEGEEGSKDCVTFYLPIFGQKIMKKEINGDSIQKFRNMLGIKLITGRKHQIRCHLSDYLQQPILNDVKYGGPKMENIEQQQKIFLHSFGLVIRKRQVIDKILAGSHISNKSLGSFTFRQPHIQFTGNVPQFWNFNKRVSLNLKSLIQKISAIEKSKQNLIPKKRNITTLT